MGESATTYWCENGHLLEDNGHHVFGFYDYIATTEYPPCPVCGHKGVFSTTEWYEQEDPIVPFDPIRHENVPRQDHHGNSYFEKVGVYDISALRDLHKCPECQKIKAHGLDCSRGRHES